MTQLLCAIFFLLQSPKGDSNIKTFIENQLPVKSNQIHEFSIYLAPKIGLAFLLRCGMLDSSDLSITKAPA